MNGKPNVIVLTSGLSGSSVLTGLISRAGYWTGKSTHKKSDYDTHENKELIDLNLSLFREAGYTGNYLVDFSADAIRNIEALYGRIDDTRYRDFVVRCNRNSPWIWKDPRLWMTIRFWRNFFRPDECRYILLTRDPMQSWISSTLRKQITTFRYSRWYEQSIQESIVDFCGMNSLPCHFLRYEDLIVRPAAAIADLNRYLGSSLAVDDLKSLYNKPLYRNPRNSAVKHAKAMLIYLKNYPERLDLLHEAK